jgi:hypothetical protein
MIIESLDKKSQENISALLQKIQGNDCCAFIGAGLSRPAGYPTWLELLTKLREEAENIQGNRIIDDDDDYYDRAENYKCILGVNNYRAILNEKFNPLINKQPRLPVHVSLIEMPFISYLTTNYDCLLEKAFVYKQENPTYNFYPLFPITHIRDRQIYHIHGVIDHDRLLQTQDSIVLTKSDFNEAYKTGSSLLDLITCVYSEVTIFFIGFNIKDKSMISILENSKKDFEYKGNVAHERGYTGIKSINHYALLSYPQIIKHDTLGRRVVTTKINYDAANQEDAELEALGVNTIRYEGDEFNHTQAIYIIDEMNSLINRISKAKIIQDFTFGGEGYE